MPNALTDGIRKILADQGLQFGGSDDDLTVALGQLNRPELGERFPDFLSDYQAIREANAPGAVRGIINTAKSAFDRSVQAKNVLGGIGETDAEDIAERERRIQDRPSSIAWEDWQRAEGPAAVRTFFRDPIEITSNIVSAGLAGSLPAIGGGLAGGAAGAAAGPVGGIVGAAIGTGAGSLAVEFGGKYLETLREAGADLADPESILRVVNDPEVRARAVEMGLRRGLPVAAFDAASAGLAGKFLKGVRTATTAQNIRRGASEAAIQGALGGGGEVAGALSAGERISPGAVFEEVVGELGPGAVEVAGAGMRRRMAERAIAPTPIAPQGLPTVAPSVVAPTSSVLPSTSPETVSPARRVSLMTDEQRSARLAELLALPTPSLDEQQELDLLRAMVGEVEAPVAPPVAPLPVAPIAPVLPELISPAAPGATGVTPLGETSSAPVAAPVEPKNNFLAPAPVSPLEEPVAPADAVVAPVVQIAPQTEIVPENVVQTAPQPPSAPAPVVPEALLSTPTVVEAGAVPAVPAVPVAETPETRVVPELSDVPPAPQPSPSLEQRLLDDLKPGKVEPFAFGNVDESSQMTADVRDDPSFDSLTPETAARISVPGAMDDSGNRHLTRVAVVLEAPDGRYVKVGLLPRQEMAKAGGAGARETGPAVQSMAAIRRRGGYQKLIKEGGVAPALLADVIAAGYKVRGFVSFDGPPGRIFQRFATREAYDAAYGASPKSTGTQAAKTIPTSSASEGVARRNAVDSRDTIQRQIDTLGTELAGADPARTAEINEEIQQLYADLGRLPEPRLATGTAPAGWESVSAQPSLPAQADRAIDFARVAARLRQAGARVDVFARTFLQASLEAEYSGRLESLIAHYQTATEAQQPALQRQIEQLQEHLASMGAVRGVAYSPTHMALGLEDIQNANLADLITLIHEAGHTTLAADPQMQARVMRAVKKLAIDLHGESRERTERTGVGEAYVGSDHEELLVHTFAQRLAEEGVPESPSLARALIQWVKDLYYRLAMALQAAFGREPSPQMALDWFENQLRRLTGGDYDYRFANLFARLMPETTSSLAQRQNTIGGTPGNLPDYYDPRTNTVRQPHVLPDSREAVEWNYRFATAAPAVNPGEEQDIPYTESAARIQAAAVNEMVALTDKLYSEAAGPVVEGQERLSFDQWWAMVGDGDQPKHVLAEWEAKVAGSGSAVIGGERMTDMMNSQARVLAKELLYHLRAGVLKRTAAIVESETAAEKTVVSEAKHVLKIEGDLRNAAMHEATFTDSFKEMVRDAIKGVRRGLDTAFAAGELNQAVREAEDLAERDAIPEEYQRVFRAILVDEVPVFQSLEAIAKLDLSLGEMTRTEIIAAIRDNAAGDTVLARLTENKPLMVALVALAKKNAQQMDMLQLRLADGPTYLKIKADMDEIRSASTARLKEMEKVFRSGKKAATYTDRIKRRMVASRAKLRRASATIQESAENRDLLAKVSTGLSEAIDELETNGLPAPSEWKASDGAKYPAMYQNEDGMWRSRERTLSFTREGPAVNAAQVAAEMVANRQYLRENPKKAGSKTYQLVERVTQEMGRLAIFQTYPELRRLFIEKVFLPSGDSLLSGGGAGAARITQMLKRFQGITFRKWHSDVEIPALNFVETWTRAAKAAGFDDINHFMDQVVEPALFLIENEPGRDEGPALREAVRIARRHLTTEPSPNFDENFKSLLRAFKERSEFFLNEVAEKEGLAIEDRRLGGELRRAVPRGWLTVIRRINAAAAGTVLTDMDAAGWKVEFQDADKNAVSERFDQAVGRGRKVVGAASFDALAPDGTSEEADAARIAVLENPEAFAQAISGFFTPGIVRRFLAPFINKPGKPVFSHGGAEIDQLEVQAAWVESGGNVARWIDLLGQRVGLEIDVELGTEMTEGALSLEAQWRLTVLKRLDSLFLMVARLAADARQTRNLFDPTGRPAHLMMDARDNELLPGEFLQHMTFDLVNSRNLLSTLAFHAAFGRNGEAMDRAIAEVQSGLRARKNAYQTVVSQRSTKAERKILAKEMGYDYNEIKDAAEIFDHMEKAIDLLKAQFGFGTPAGVLGDVRGALEFLHFTATQMTNNPKTGLLNLLQLFQRALTRRSLGPGVMRDTVAASGGFAYNFFGGVLEKFGLNILRSSEHVKLVGALNGQGIGDVPPSILMGVAVGKRGEELPKAIKGMRAMNALQQRGIGFRQREFQRAKIIPFVENTMAGLGLTAAISNGTQEAITIERIVKAGMDYFTSHPDDAANPAFRFTAKTLGMDGYGWFGDQGSFDYYVRKLPEYGLGTLEKLAHDGMERATRAEPILDKEQVALAAMIAGNELDLQSSINTSPASWGTNSFVRFMTPLLSWPIKSMNAVHQAMREADGRGSALAAVRALGILAAWMLPMGLAFTFLTDEYDERVLKKKSNLGRLPGVSGVPVVGPLIGLATSDIPPMEQAKSILKRISRANNIYGLGSDFASSVLSGLDPTSGARPFSLDSRVLAFSQLRTIADAFNSFISSGGAITWTTVERPLIQAMGGNGALSAIDIFNAALGLNNDQSRAVARTNLQQWLRTAGSEIGLELRRSGGAVVAPTPVSVWVREMNFAAISNDRLLFLENWRRAVDAAREEGADDPEADVLRSWKGRNPLTVFQDKPTDTQIARMMSVMDDTGRAVVRDGLRLFEQFTTLISPSRAEVYQRQMLVNARRTGVPTVESLRRQMAGASLSFR